MSFFHRASAKTSPHQEQVETAGTRPHEQMVSYIKKSLQCYLITHHSPNYHSFFTLYLNTGNRNTSFIQNAVKKTIQRQADLVTTMALRGDLSPQRRSLMDMFIQEINGRSVVKTMTSFTSQMLDALWDQVGVDITVRMANCKGAGSKTTPKDSLFILISVLKDPTTWAKHGLNFNMSAQRVQRLVTRGLKVLAPLGAGVIGGISQKI